MRSFRKIFFLFSGHPFIGRESGGMASHLGLESFTEVPGIGFPVSSCAHQQYPKV